MLITAENSVQNNLKFPVNNFRQVKEKVLNWAQRFNTFCFLDNHQYQIEPHTQECLLAAGVKKKLSLSSGNAMTQLQGFVEDSANKWLFGHLGYDLKNELEGLSSNQPDHIGFPDLFFFEPEIIIRLNKNEMIIECDDPLNTYNEILNTIVTVSYAKTDSVRIKNKLQKEQYVAIIEKLRKHILIGDCYEINFCHEFFAENAAIDPVYVYQELSNISPNPFSAFYRLQDKWLMCASPERFLRKEGTRILSQPIKGTSKRVQNDEERDKQNKDELFLSSKDRSENVMVVDVVRNDLAKVCKEGSVQVDELYGVYSFPQVHQMISTISGELKNDILFSEIIKATFPMGSMTGAPKRKVMELIEKYEQTKRGIFSGAIGYISPAGDFDFNVVIRSIMYNSFSRYLSFQAGSGITFYSDAAKEWEECLLKAEAIQKVLTGS